MQKLLVLTGLSVLAPFATAETVVYFGTYTRGDSQGIYKSSLKMDTGELSQPELAAEVSNPSFVAIHPSGKYLYSVSEISNVDGKKTGVVCAFSVGNDGKLTLLNQKESGGAGPCHVSLDPRGKTVMVANYGGGSVASYPVREDGKLGEAATVIQHEGSSIDERRQAGPHAHSINTDPAGKRAFAADLGLDKLVIYNLNADTGKLSPNDPAFVKFPGASGPRHFAFHPSGKFAFANLEMSLEIAALSYDQATGAMEVIEIVSTVEDGTPREGNSTAETLVHPSGKWVYVSNRGPNSVAVFSINQNTGELTFIERESTQGETPRGFGIDPSGNFLIAGNQNSGNVAVFRINQNTGALSPTGHSVELANCVNVRFLIQVD